MSKIIAINNLMGLILVLAGGIILCGEHKGLIMA
jgi:hypothetical protein